MRIVVYNIIHLSKKIFFKEIVDAIYIFYDDRWSSKLALLAWETREIN